MSKMERRLHKLKKKTTTRIIAIVLCAVTILGVVAGVIGINANPTSEMEATIMEMLGPKKRITNEQITNAVAQHKNKDFSLETLIKHLGNPGGIMLDYNGLSPSNYANDEDIASILKDYAKDSRYNKNSIIQLMWLDTDDNLVFTCIATDYNTPTIVGLVKQSLKTIAAGRKYIPKTTHTLKEFKSYTSETLKNFEDTFVSSIQYPLLECYYTKQNLNSTDFGSTWTTKVVQNKTGLIYILLKNDKPYQIYQDYDSNKIKTYDKSTKLWTGLNERQFLNVYPDALKIQLFNHVEDGTEHFIVSYVVKEKGSNGKVKEVIYNIVDDDLYVYDDKGNLVQNNGGLIIENNGSSKPKEEPKDETTKPTETTKPPVLAP